MPDDRRPAAWDLYWTTVEGQLGVGPSGFVRWALPFLASAPGNELVELGSGAGRDLRFLIENGFRVRGVDFSVEAVRIARQLLATLPDEVSGRGTVERGEAVEFLKGQLSEQSTAVVGIVLYQTFSDEELLRLFAEVHRALRPGGLHLWCVRDDQHPLRDRRAMVPPNQGGTSESLVDHAFFSEARCDALSAAGFERVRLDRRPETHYLFVADRKPGASPAPLL
ncbi:MAG: class I SAM-dependent methyltransferase [Thermoplasmata archaeon]|nr:class I SAM-dependent methyltransferase [Thermoplasmata archaeon]